MQTRREAPKYGNPPTVGEPPINLEELAFANIPKLAEYIRTKKVSSVALTEMYIERIRRFNPVLHFLITLTEERAMAQAKAADAEIASNLSRSAARIALGRKRSARGQRLFHHLGAGGFSASAPFDYDATSRQTLCSRRRPCRQIKPGRLGHGESWFGGSTPNPWSPCQGSSGSSAGPACATAAGCVAFSIGSETLGSISSPSTRCGVTGLRPTFGFVPRTGAMALSWTMDKLGPICRSVEDCALVMNSIYGPDGKDLSVRDAAFNWDANFDWRTLSLHIRAMAMSRPPSRFPAARGNHAYRLALGQTKKMARGLCPSPALPATAPATIAPSICSSSISSEAWASN